MTVHPKRSCGSPSRMHVVAAFCICCISLLSTLCDARIVNVSVGCSSMIVMHSSAISGSSSGASSLLFVVDAGSILSFNQSTTDGLSIRIYDCNVSSLLGDDRSGVSTTVLLLLGQQSHHLQTATPPQQNIDIVFRNSSLQEVKVVLSQRSLNHTAMAVDLYHHLDVNTTTMSTTWLALQSSSSNHSGTAPSNTTYVTVSLDGEGGGAAGSSTFSSISVIHEEDWVQHCMQDLTSMTTAVVITANSSWPYEVYNLSNTSSSDPGTGVAWLINNAPSSGDDCVVFAFTEVSASSLTSTMLSGACFANTSLFLWQPDVGTQVAFTLQVDQVVSTTSRGVCHETVVPLWRFFQMAALNALMLGQYIGSNATTGSQATLRGVLLEVVTETSLALFPSMSMLSNAAMLSYWRDVALPAHPRWSALQKRWNTTQSMVFISPTLTAVTSSLMKSMSLVSLDISLSNSSLEQQCVLPDANSNAAQVEHSNRIISVFVDPYFMWSCESGQNTSENSSRWSTSVNTTATSSMPLSIQIGHSNLTSRCETNNISSNSSKVSLINIGVFDSPSNEALDVRAILVQHWADVLTAYFTSIRAMFSNASSAVAFSNISFHCLIAPLDTSSSNNNGSISITIVDSSWLNVVAGITTATSGGTVTNLAMMVPQSQDVDSSNNSASSSVSWASYTLSVSSQDFVVPYVVEINISSSSSLTTVITVVVVEGGDAAASSSSTSNAASVGNVIVGIPLSSRWFPTVSSFVNNAGNANLLLLQTATASFAWKTILLHMDGAARLVSNVTVTIRNSSMTVPVHPGRIVASNILLISPQVAVSSVNNNTTRYYGEGVALANVLVDISDGVSLQALVIIEPDVNASTFSSAVMSSSAWIRNVGARWVIGGIMSVPECTVLSSSSSCSASLVLLYEPTYNITVVDSVIDVTWTMTAPFGLEAGDAMGVAIPMARYATSSSYANASTWFPSASQISFSNVSCSVDVPFPSWDSLTASNATMIRGLAVTMSSNAVHSSTSSSSRIVLLTTSTVRVSMTSSLSPLNLSVVSFDLDAVKSMTSAAVLLTADDDDGMKATNTTTMATSATSRLSLVVASSSLSVTCGNQSGVGSSSSVVDSLCSVVVLSTVSVSSLSPSHVTVAVAFNTSSVNASGCLSSVLTFLASRASSGIAAASLVIAISMDRSLVVSTGRHIFDLRFFANQSNAKVLGNMSRTFDISVRETLLTLQPAELLVVHDSSSSTVIDDVSSAILAMTVLGQNHGDAMLVTALSPTQSTVRVSLLLACSAVSLSSSYASSWARLVLDAKITNGTSSSDLVANMVTRQVDVAVTITNSNVTSLYYHSPSSNLSVTELFVLSPSILLATASSGERDNGSSGTVAVSLIVRTSVIYRSWVDSVGVQSSYRPSTNVVAIQWSGDVSSTSIVTHWSLTVRMQRVESVLRTALPLNLALSTTLITLMMITSNTSSSILFENASVLVAVDHAVLVIENSSNPSTASSVLPYNTTAIPVLTLTTGEAMSELFSTYNPSTSSCYNTKGTLCTIVDGIMVLPNSSLYPLRHATIRNHPVSQVVGAPLSPFMQSTVSCLSSLIASWTLYSPTATTSPSRDESSVSKSVSPSTSIDTASPTKSAHVSKSTPSPSTTVSIDSSTRSVHQTHSTLSPTSSGTTTFTETHKHSRSTMTPSLTRNTVSASFTRHHSRSTVSPTASKRNGSFTKSLLVSDTRVSVTLSATDTWSDTVSIGTLTPNITSSKPHPSRSSSDSLSPSTTNVTSFTRSLGVTGTTEVTNSSTLSPTMTHRRNTTSATDTESRDPLTASRSMLWTDTPRLTPSRSTRISSSRSIPQTQSARITNTMTLPLPMPNSPCPIPVISISPFDTMSDEAVRTTPMFLWFNLSGIYRWSINAPQLMKASPVSTGSQPERMGWMYTINMTCSLVGDKQHLACRIPATPSYLLLVAETIEFTISNDAFEIVSCSPSNVYLTQVYVATETPLKLLAAKTLSAVIGVEGFFASWFGAQAMVYDGHLIAMVGQMSCASTLDDYMTMRLMYLVAPMSDYGPIAVAYFNMFIVACFFAVHVGATMVIAQRKSMPINDAAEISAFPGLSYCCAVAIHAGVCYGTMQIALNSSTDAMSIASAGGFLYLIAIFVVLFYVLRRFATVSFVEYGFVRTLPIRKRIFLPQGYWDPKQPRRMFGRMLVTVGAGRVMYVPYQMVVITAFSVITSVRPKTLPGCRALFFTIGGVMVLVASQVAWWRPHRVPFQNASTVCTMLLLAVQCFLQAPASADHTLDLDDAKAAIWLLQFVIVAARGFFDVFIVMWENFKWGKQREPLFGVLDEDYFGLEDHKVEMLDEPLFDEGKGEGKDVASPRRDIPTASAVNAESPSFGHHYESFTYHPPTVTALSPLRDVRIAVHDGADGEGSSGGGSLSDDDML